jgi:hypothetical protein
MSSVDAALEEHDTVAEFSDGVLTTGGVGWIVRCWRRC